MKPSVFTMPAIATAILETTTQTQDMSEESEMPCKEFHGINGYLPKENDHEYDGQKCDCGRITFYLELCGCPANIEKTYKLKTKPSEG